MRKSFEADFSKKPDAIAHTPTPRPMLAANLILELRANPEANRDLVASVRGR